MMKILRKFFNKFDVKLKTSYKRTSFVWLMSYLVIFLLPFVTSMFVHFEAVDILTEQSTEMAEQIISIEQKEFDQLYELCNTTYISVLNNPKVTGMMRMSSSGEISEMDVYELKRDLFQIMVDENPLLDDVWIVFNNIDYGISTLRAEPLSDFYVSESLSGGSRLSLEDTNGEYKGEFIRTTTGFAYIRTIGLSADGEESINVLLLFDKNALRDRYYEFMPSDSGVMLLYNSNNEFIYSSRDVSDNFAENGKNISREDSKVSIDENKYLVSSGELYNVRYIYLLEENVITRPMRVLKIIILITAIFSIIIGVMMILYLVKRNIKPVNDIVNMLGTDTGESNEFDVIKKGISKQSKDNINLSKQVSLFRPLAMSNILQNLVLHGSMDRYLMGHLDIQLDREFLTLSAIDVDCLGIFFENDDEELIENNQQLMEFAVMNIFSELLEEHGNVYFGVLQNKIVILINSDDECTEDIHKSMSQGSKLINQHFDITLYIAQAKCVSTIDDLPKAYDAVQEQLDNMQISGNHGASICSVADRSINKIENERKSDFVKYVFEADCENATRVLSETIYSSMPKGLLRYFVADMITEAADELSRKIGKNVDVTDIISLVMDSHRVHNIENQLTEFTEKLCSLSVDKDSGIETKVYELINEKYLQPELNVTVIAANFNITPAYLSYKFRERYHINILDYLAKLRIEHAKQLILETNGTVEEIYHECGYTNRATFIRQFKKYVDLTPSKFKKLYS